MTDAVANVSARRAPAFSVSLRLAMRGLRLSGFGIFLACVALGVGAISGVGSVSRSFSDGLAKQGRVILGGDLSFSFMSREISAPQRAWLSSRASVASVAALRAMARKPDGGSPALINLKAVDASWPSQGAAVTDPPRPISELLAAQGGREGLIADPALAARLNLKLGDPVKIGDQIFRLAGTLVSEPDSLSDGATLGPQVIVTQKALTETGLLQPGSLVRWTYRVNLPSGDTPTSDAQVVAFIQDANHAFPSAGWEARSRNNVSPQFAKSLQQLTQFLTLVSLTALIVGGVGVANAVRSFVDKQRLEFAVFKALGAAGSDVFLLSLWRVVVMTALGAAFGVTLGACIPYFLSWAFGRLSPLPFYPMVYPIELIKGAFYGVLVTLAFSIAPLGRAHDAPVAALFRDRIDPERRLPRPQYLAMVVCVAAVLIAAIVFLSTDRRIAAIYLLATFAAFLLLRSVAWLLMALARRAPHVQNVAARLAISNIYRPGALTPSIVLSLGLGLALLVTLTILDGNLRREIGQATPGQTPSLFFLDVPTSQSSTFASFVGQNAPKASLQEAPMLRGRITQVNGVAAENVKAGDDAAWTLQGDRGLTYATAPPPGSVVASGSWWPAAYSGPPLVSLDASIAAGLGLKIGDTITVNALGREVTAQISNLRRVNWRTLGINFVLVFSPNAFAGAPHTTLATATFPEDSAPSADLDLLRKVADAYPSVTTIRVKDALDALNGMLDKVVLAIRAASAVALAAAVLVLAGALASSQNDRIYDAVILKTLGATRSRLLLAFVMEYALLGAATAVFGIATGGAAAWAILVYVMKIDMFLWLWQSALVAAFGALGMTILLGLIGTFSALSRKPAVFLRTQ